MKVTAEQIEEALRANGAFISQTAKKLGIAHSTLNARIRRSPRLQEVVDEVRESFLDLSEFQLINQVKEGNLGAICFHLKCKGKNRGYVEKAIDSEQSSEPVPVNIVIGVEDAS